MFLRKEWISKELKPAYHEYMSMSHPPPPPTNYRPSEVLCPLWDQQTMFKLNLFYVVQMMSPYANDVKAKSSLRALYMEMYLHIYLLFRLNLFAI